MKKLVLIIIVIICIAAVAYLAFFKKESNQPSNNISVVSNNNTATENTTINDPSKGTIVDVKELKNKRILVEKHYINYAFSFVHKGTILCSDGTIYNFEYSNQEELPTRPYEKIIEESDEVISHVTTFEGRVPEDELARLTELLTTIDADYESDSVAMDKGEDTIIYYDYDDNEVITLQSTGDSIVTNVSKNTNKILDILDLYQIRLTE